MFSSIDGTLFSLREAKKSITRKDQTRPASSNSMPTKTVIRSPKSGSGSNHRSVLIREGYWYIRMPTRDGTIGPGFIRGEPWFRKSPVEGNSWRVARGSRSGSRNGAVRERPDAGTRRAGASQEGSQGSDRLWRALHVRDLAARARGWETVARCLRADVSRRDAAWRVGREHHAILAPLRGGPSRLLRSGHRSQGASTDDPRDGGSSAGLHHGRAQAAPFRDPRAFRRVHRQPLDGQTHHGRANARHDQQTANGPASCSPCC